MALTAYDQLHAIQREQAAVAELPIAQLAALTANINRDPAKGQPFTTSQWCMFRDESAAISDGISPEAAAVALALRHTGQCPPMVIAIWSDILEASKARPDAAVPAIRALVSDDQHVWVLAPRWEGRNVRGGLVVVHGQLSGLVLLRELDRPLMRYRVRLPARQGFGWVESDLLLLGEATA